MTTILIAAGGNGPPLSILDELPAFDHVLAADSGHETASDIGFAVDVLIGDMDSLPHEASIGAPTEVIRHPTDKDATDLELAFEYAMRLQPERIILIGGEGGRIDHEFSTLAVIGSNRWSVTPEIDWVRSDGVVHVVRRTRRIHGDIGDLISLVAVHGTARGVTTKGLKWDLDDADLFAGSSLGTSNRFTAPTATIIIGDGTVYAIVPTVDSARQPLGD